MALDLTDRLLTVAVTATLTSAAWVVVGSGYLENTGSRGAVRDAAPTGPQTAVASDAAPVVASPATLAMPVSGVRADQLTDSFGDERGGVRLHEALDIAAPAGTPVVAAAPGTIERLFASKAGGNTIYLRSDDRATIHYYAHLQAYAPGLREGQRVERGDRLGTVGSTGNADPSAPHLHFAVLQTTPDAEWWEPAKAINPYLLLGGK